MISSGQPSPEAIEAAKNMDIDLLNPSLPGILGGDINAWQKVYVDTWGGQTLETSSGKRFELHFYRSLADDINTTIDFKIVFKDSIP